MNKNFVLIMMLAGVIALLSACGGGGGGGGATPPGGTPGTGLSVVSITPAANAVDVARSTAITAVFSSTLDCATVLASSITVTDAGGSAVAGTVSCGGANAGFTPAATLTDETVYTVAVSGTVKDSAGNALSGDYTWSFTTKAAGWGTSSAVDTSLTASQSSSPYSLGTDTQGHARVIYNASDGGVGAMLSSSYVPGSGWTSSFYMGGPVFGGTPVFKFNAKGDGVALWRENDSQFYAKTYSRSTGWSLATRVSDTNAGNFSVSFANWAAAIDGNGNAIAAWSQQVVLGVNGTCVYASRYTPANGWAAPVLIGSGTDSRYPQVGMDENGNGIVLWSENTGFINYRIRSKYYDVSTESWGDMEEVSGATTYFAGSSQIAFDAGGNAIAVWEQTDGTWNTYPNPDHERYSVRANRYVPGTGWGAPVEFGRDSLGDSSEAKIAVAANGKAVAIWRFKKDASNFTHYYNIGAAHFDGSGWHMGNTPLYWTVVAGETGSGYQSDMQGPDVTVDSSGRETLVWYKAVDSSNYDIYSYNYTPADGWTNYTTLGTTTNVYPRPMVIAEDSGAVTSVWTILDGSRYVMWSNRND